MPNEKWNAVALAAGVVVLAIGGPWLVGELRSLPHPAALMARADQRIVTLEVGGMTCANCAAAIRGSIASVPGVSTVDVRRREGRAYVVCARGLADSSLTDAVQRAGPGFLAAVVAP